MSLNLSAEQPAETAAEKPADDVGPIFATVITTTFKPIRLANGANGELHFLIGDHSKPLTLDPFQAEAFRLAMAANGK